MELKISENRIFILQNRKKAPIFGFGNQRRVDRFNPMR